MRLEKQGFSNFPIWQPSFIRVNIFETLNTLEIRIETFADEINHKENL